MKKYISIVLIVCTLVLAGCTGNASVNRKTGESFCNDSSQFIFVEQFGEDYYIVADKNTKYEYYVTAVHAKYSVSYVIGGNVLDENGKPKKYTSK